MNIKIITLILVLTSALFARDIIIEDTHVLMNDVNPPFYFPAYTVDGKSILMTQNAYVGLWVMDRTSEQIEQITSSQGAGFQPRSLTDGSIIYRQDEYVKGRKFTSLYKADSEGKHLLVEGSRFISPANLVNDRLIYLANETPTILNGISGQLERNLEAYTTVLNDKLTMKLFKDGTHSVIAPQGEGSYIWSSLSPEQDKLVYTKTGQGTFVCDLQGKIISNLGVAHAPQWSPQGEYLVFMKDLDNGDHYTESEIWISSFDGEYSWKITDTPDVIEMYPQWSPDGKRVVYHTLLGQIIETSIEIVE